MSKGDRTLLSNRSLLVDWSPDGVRQLSTFDQDTEHNRQWAANMAGNDPAHSRVYTFDVKELRPIDRDEYEHAERTFTAAFADCQRLRPDFRPDDAVAAELIRLRQRCAAMETVVAAADEWNRGSFGGTPEKIDEALRKYNAQSTTPAAVEPVLSAEGQATYDRLRERYTPPTPGTLTPEEWAALQRLQHVLNERDDYHSPVSSLLNNTDRFDITTAIDKLRLGGGS